MSYIDVAVLQQLQPVISPHLLAAPALSDESKRIRESYAVSVPLYVFIEKVDSNHDCCRRECAKETSAPGEGVVRA